MKTQIIQLEAHDDVISTRDKMGTSQASRVLLVWPHKSHILNRKLDLLLLQRCGNRLGIQFALITTNRTTRHLASELGIQTFDSTHQAQTKRWRTSSKNRKSFRRNRNPPDLASLYQDAHPTSPAWIKHPGLRFGFFAISLIAVAALMASLLPTAHISLKLQTVEQILTIPIKSDLTLDSPSLVGEVPAFWTDVVVEGRDTISTSGTTLVPEKPAIGEVVFKNLTEQTLEIPSGTVVTTLEQPLVKFFTTKTVRVPSGVGTPVTVPVQAVIPGRNGNLPANHLQAIEGSIGLSLSVDNPQPTHTGSDQPVPSPTDQDRGLLLERLRDSLMITAQEEIERNLPKTPQLSDFALLPSLRLKQILEKTYSADVGQPANEITLLLRLEFEYQVVAADQLQALVNPLLSAEILPGFQVVPGSLQIEHHIPVLEDSDDSYHWEITARQISQNQFNPQKASLLVRGMRIDQAVIRLQQELTLTDRPVIQTTPSWWPFLPFIPFRIEINLQTENS